MKPSVLLMQGRLDEALGPRAGRARQITATSSRPSDRLSASEAKLLEITQQQKHNEISQEDAFGARWKSLR